MNAYIFRNFQKIKFKVALVRIDETNTEVAVRVGLRGNREISRQFLAEIETILQ
ncbi:MAG: DUF3568 family protein [Lentisphaerae bacterium]|nr:DUF3568 family protein [Lentisphaerota bacterium]MBT6217981.1 DUF3568 family protein [Candidatus Neomarinimicrobiota bacterium]MBT4816373.1 DUF3568 family protein [Lentisphaerota bacterium]MBT5610737.1 DUF3568 family protein [Lentisphaerota bacterium]MBT7054306.1 DUF3568 family protein [Lentisphaerota bacterium]